jgi:hypothetical protein
MARGGHGIPKVSPGPAMPDPSTPCGRATAEMALCPYALMPLCPYALMPLCPYALMPLFRGGPPAGQAACSRLLPLWTPHAVNL